MCRKKKKQTDQQRGVKKVKEGLKWGLKQKQKQTGEKETGGGRSKNWRECEDFN